MTARTPLSRLAADVSIDLITRVRVRAAQDLADEHARHLEVDGVLGLAGHLGDGVDARDSLADDAGLSCTTVSRSMTGVVSTSMTVSLRDGPVSVDYARVHVDSTSASRHFAASTASTIFT